MFALAMFVSSHFKKPRSAQHKMLRCYFSAADAGLVELPEVGAGAAGWMDMLLAPGLAPLPVVVPAEVGSVAPM